MKYLKKVRVHYKILGGYKIHAYQEEPDTLTDAFFRDESGKFSLQIENQISRYPSQKDAENDLVKRIKGGRVKKPRNIWIGKEGDKMKELKTYEFLSEENKKLVS